MKKSKLIIPTVATLCVVPNLTVALTSCNKTNSDVVIKQNENVTIKASTVTKGEAYTINFSLSSGYAFDVENSTITFGTDAPLYLIDCEIQAASKKIVVPKEFVSDTKVVIDIKAETNAVLTELTQAEYDTAWSNLYDGTNLNRKFTMTGYAAAGVYTEFGEYITSSLGFRSVEANGVRTHSVKTVIDEKGEEVNVGEYWSTKNAPIGYMDYEKPYKSDTIYIYPMTEGNADAWFRSMYLRFATSIEDLEQDRLLNVFRYEHLEGTAVVDSYVKFDSNKKITYYGFSRRQTVEGQIHLDRHGAQIEYECASITLPTKAQVAKEYVHEFDDQTCALSTVLGEYSVPTGGLDVTKKVVLKFDKPLIGIPADMILIHNGAKQLTRPSEWQYDQSAGTITISANKFTTMNTIYITIGNAYMVDITGAEQVTLTQED